MKSKVRKLIRPIDLVVSDAKRIRSWLSRATVPMGILFDLHCYLRLCYMVATMIDLQE